MLRTASLRAAKVAGGAAAAANPGTFRFVASDMDGTVLSPHHTLSEYTAETLRRLTQDHHVPFIFATGRVYADVAAINQHMQRFFQERRLQLPPVPSTPWARTPTYIITSNGAVAHDAETGSLVLERALDPGVVRELYHLLPRSETRINTGIIQGEHWFYRMDWEEMLQFHRESGYRYRVLQHIPELGVAKGSAGTTNTATTIAAASSSSCAVEGDLAHVHKVFFSSWDRPLLEKLESLLQQRYGDHLTVTFSAAYNVDITAKGVTKASALEQLFTTMPPLPHETASSATPEQRLKATVAFGDDLNDAAMLSGVGRGYIMGNCNPQLRQRCPQLEVIETNAHDAVARKLRELFRLE
ncbi:haloacid dehalogenase-like hydrolase/Sucrose-6F-phosphate phosphohydrolase [Novymonas esmeraldas]|uniref:Haloacid dehalogenase-like hydrolase/Sucrose-6F-phosphate phosphohydrolase n=1 Tax=Novymonas esmeraldas TaxID=1808958 RepID=A0AAW0EQ81_9TRYP